MVSLSIMYNNFVLRFVPCLPLLFTKVVDYIFCALSISHNPSYIQIVVVEHVARQPLDDATSFSYCFATLYLSLSL